MRELLRRLVVPHFDDEDLNSRALNLNVILLITFVVMLLGVVAMLFQIGSRPLSYVLPNMAFILIAALIVGLCYVLSHRGRVAAGSIIFVGMMTVACTGAVVVGGTRGALSVILIIPVASAGVTLSGNASLTVAALSIMTTVAAGLLERGGVIKVVYPADEMTILLNMFDVGFALVFATLSIWLASYSVRQALGRTRAAVVDADRYRQQLEESLSIEQRIRDNLQHAVSDYAAFLDQIVHGDYTVRLSPSEGDVELTTLGQQINGLVDTLVSEVARAESALHDAREAQRRYVVQSWRDYGQSAATDFTLGDASSEDALRDVLAQALTQQNVIAAQPGKQEIDKAGSALAVPIVLGGQVTGMLALYREEDARPWSEDQRALVSAVVDRLALAIDSQRLFRDVQRRAAREQVSAQVTARIRESLDMETVLKTAAKEMRQALGLDKITVHLGTSQE